MSITVTATPTGASGATLRVLVLTGATASGGANQQPTGNTGGHVTLTPAFSNSFIAWANNNVGSNGAFTGLANNTILDNIATTGGQRMATGYYSGTVTAASAVSAGATGASTPTVTSAYEIPASGGSTPLIDASSPAVVSITTGTTALTTASFTPPGSAVLVAIVTGANFPSAWTVTDSSSLTWTKRADNTDGQQIWTATTAAGGTTSGTAALTGAGTLTVGGAFAGAAGLSGSGTLSAAETIGWLATMSGAGTLGAAETIATAAALSGSGTLGASPAFTAAAPMAGSGTLTAAGVLAALAGLSGSGTLTAGGLFTGAATLSGSGTLSGIEQLAAAAALSGSGTLSSTWTAGGQATAPLSGSGTLSAAARFGAAAALLGLGTLTAGPTRSVPVTLSGLGTLKVFPAPFLSNTGEGGVNGTTVTIANSGAASGNPWDNVPIGSGATLTYDNTRSPHGTLSYKVTTGITATTALAEWTTTEGTVTTIWYRIYCFIPSGPVTPAWRAFAARNSGGHAGSLLLSGTAIQLSVSTAFNTVSTFTTPIPIGRWFRVEGFVTGDPVAGVISASVYTSMDSTTPAETRTLTGQNTTGVLNGYFFGQNNSIASSGPFWFGDAGISAAGPLGPTGPGAAMSGVGTLSAGSRFAGAVLLSGSGTLGGPETIIPAVTLTGSGLLAVSAQLQGSAALSGQGTLSGTPRSTIQAAATLTGSGLLAVSALIGSPAALSGSGSLGLAPTVLIPGLAPLSGSGTLNALPTVAGPSPAYLFAVYQRLAMIAQRAGILYRETVIAGGRGMAGRQYAVAYEAEVAADLAYQAWLQASQ